MMIFPHYPFNRATIMKYVQPIPGVYQLFDGDGKFLTALCAQDLKTKLLDHAGDQHDPFANLAVSFTWEAAYDPEERRARVLAQYASRLSG